MKSQEFPNQETAPLHSIESQSLEKNEQIKEVLLRIFNLDTFPKPSEVGFRTFSDHIARAIEYTELHPDGFLCEEYFDPLKPESKLNLLDMTILKLGLSHPLDIEAQEKLYTYLQAQLSNTGHVYHGFNRAFKESVDQNGLDPHIYEKQHTDMQEIIALGRKYGDPLILGFAGLNSRGRISFDANPMRTYQYACISPEWFAHLCGYNVDYTEKEIDEEAYLRKDYAQCRKNVEIYVSRNKYSDEDRQKLLAFFEENWKNIAAKDSGPALAMIDCNTALQREFLPENFNAFLEQVGKQPSLDPTQYREYFNLPRSYRNSTIDRYTENLIPPSKITTIDLPNYYNA